MPLLLALVDKNQAKTNSGNMARWSRGLRPHGKSNLGPVPGPSRVRSSERNAAKGFLRKLGFRACVLSH